MPRIVHVMIFAIMSIVATGCKSTSLSDEVKTIRAKYTSSKALSDASMLNDQLRALIEKDVEMFDTTVVDISRSEISTWVDLHYLVVAEKSIMKKCESVVYIEWQGEFRADTFHSLKLFHAPGNMELSNTQINKVLVECLRLRDRLIGIKRRLLNADLISDVNQEIISRLLTLEIISPDFPSDIDAFGWDYFPESLFVLNFDVVFSLDDSAMHEINTDILHRVHNSIAIFWSKNGSAKFVSILMVTGNDVDIDMMRNILEQFNE